MGLSFFVCIIMRLVLASLLGYSSSIFIGKNHTRIPETIRNQVVHKSDYVSKKKKHKGDYQKAVVQKRRYML